MYSIDNVMKKKRGKWYLMQRDRKLIKVVERWLKCRPYKDSSKGYYWPVKEVKILHLAKASGLSYQQVRDRLDKWCREGKIEKWMVATSYQKNGNYYRLKAGN